jgi:hypothetical protein
MAYLRLCGLHSCNIKEDKINTRTTDIPDKDSTERLKTIPPVGDAEGAVEKQETIIGHAIACRPAIPSGISKL